MKTLLLLLIGISASGYYYSKEIEKFADQLTGEDKQQIVQQLANRARTQSSIEGMDKIKGHSEQTKVQNLLTNDNPEMMTIHELSNCKRPDCLNEFMRRNTKAEKTEVDKLMNFFSRGKYE